MVDQQSVTEIILLLNIKELLVVVVEQVLQLLIKHLAVQEQEAQEYQQVLQEDQSQELVAAGEAEIIIPLQQVLADQEVAVMVTAVELE